MPENKEISLEELLAEQTKTVTLATVEALPGKDDMVKVTPWIAGRGCACRFALVVPKQDISRLLRTEHRHHCCGKIHTVVEVEFKEGSSLPVSDVFSDLSRRAASIPRMRPPMRPLPSHPRGQRGKVHPMYRSYHPRIPTFWPVWPKDPYGFGLSDDSGDDGDNGDNGDPYNGMNNLPDDGDDGDPGELGPLPDVSEACYWTSKQACLDQFAQYGSPTNSSQDRFCSSLANDQCAGTARTNA